MSFPPLNFSVKGAPRTGRINFFVNQAEDKQSIDIRQYNQHLIEVQGVNSSGTGIAAYRPGPINIFSTFKQEETYLLLAKSDFNILTKGMQVNATGIFTKSGSFQGYGTNVPSITIKGSSTAQRGRPTIFIYPFKRSQPISVYNNKINLVYSPNSTSSFLRSYRPNSGGNGFTTFEPGQGYIIWAKEDIVLTNPDVAQPVPTATQVPPPTQTPFPDPTPNPTSTPFPSPTPRPTNTPQPTSTPFPTNTPLPTATVHPPPTPRPTSTPEPTRTPVPTATQVPTPTPLPTSTPLPTPTITNNTQAVQFSIFGPKSAVEGDTVTLNIRRVGGADDGATITRAWDFSGSGITLADFQKINGATPSSLAGTATLTRSYEAGRPIYNGTVSFQFFKDGAKEIQGIETPRLTLTGLTQDGGPVFYEVAVSDSFVAPTFNLSGPASIVEGNTATVTITRTGGTHVGNTLTRPWAVGGANILLRDFELINGVVPTQLFGNVTLTYTSGTLSNPVYTGTVTFKFKKDKQKAVGGSETFNFTLDTGLANDSEGSRAISIKVLDNPLVLQYLVEGADSTVEGNLIAFHIRRRNTGSRAAFIDVPWQFVDNDPRNTLTLSDFVSINDVKPSSLSGVVRLLPDSTTQLNLDGGYNYSARFTMQFQKDKQKAVGGQEKINFIIKPADAAQVVKQFTIFDNPLPVEFEIIGPSSASEGDTVDFVINRKGGGNVSSTRNAQWTVSGAGINTADFTRINGTTPASLNGRLNLRNTGAANRDRDGGFKYTDTWQFSFAKNKDRTRGGFERFRFTVDDEYSKPAFKEITIFDKAVPPAPPAPVNFNLSGPAAVTEGQSFTITIVGTNLPAGPVTKPFTISGGGIEPGDFAPSAPLQGNITFPGSAAGRTETVTFTRTTSRTTVDEAGKKIVKNRPGRARAASASFEIMNFNFEGKQLQVRINEAPPQPTPTPTPVPAPIVPVLVSVTPLAPGRPCVGTRPLCTNGSAKITHRLGVIAGAVQNTVNVYINNKLVETKAYTGALATPALPLEVTVNKLTGGQTYTVHIVNEGKQQTASSTFTVPAYV